MISVTGIFPGLRQQVHFSDFVNVQIFLDFFETSLVVKLYSYTIHSKNYDASSVFEFKGI